MADSKKANVRSLSSVAPQLWWCQERTSVLISDMPRVSQEHLDARREQILAAANRCFARQGFHQTSMQDVFTEAGLSAGAFYRYFASKEDLIAAIVNRVGDAVDEAFTTVLDKYPASLDEVFEELIDSVDRAADSVHGSSRLAIQVWAEALRVPELAARVRRVYQTAHGHFVEIARRERAAGKLSGDADLTLVGRGMLSLLLGFIVQRHLYGEITSADYARGIRMLRQTHA